MLALRYLDIVLLVLALPVFLAADLPMLGYAAAGRERAPRTPSSATPRPPDRAMLCVRAVAATHHARSASPRQRLR